MTLWSAGNRWYRICYSLWAPFYDRLAGHFRRQRCRSFELLGLRPGEKVLIVGAGTGLDLEWIRPDIQLTAIDLTPAMLARLKDRAQSLHLRVDARVMDAQLLEFPDGTFDVAILHLIVAVIPDPTRCLKEVHRVLRPGGRAVVFDKFVPDGRKVPLVIRLLNPVISLLGTRIDRQLGSLLSASGHWLIVHDEPAMLHGLFRVVLLRKP